MANNKLNDVILNAVREKKFDIVRAHLETNQKTNFTDWVSVYFSLTSLAFYQLFYFK